MASGDPRHGSWLIADGYGSWQPLSTARGNFQQACAFERAKFCHVFCTASSFSQRFSQETFLEQSRSMASQIITERAFEFARRIVLLCERLWKRGPAARKIADQLFDSGTSIGANAHEAQGAQTKPDFIAKLSVSRKESWETLFWLRLGVASNVMSKDEVAWELAEAQELRTMITSGIKTAQSSPSRGL